MSVIFHGLKSFEHAGKKVTASARKLDTLSVTWQSDREDTFRNGGQIPGYSFMDIEECETLEEIPNLAYEHRLRGIGLLKPGHKLESNSLNQPEEGWDEGPQTWLTTAPDSFAIGNAHPQIPTLWCVGMSEKEQVTSRVWRVSPSYKGIIPIAGSTKPEKWRGTLNGQTVSTGSAITFYGQPWIVNESGSFNGWATPSKGEFDASQVTVICSKLSFTPPPTDRVGRSYTPARVPLMDNIYEEAGWVSAAGFTLAWPAGWRLSGVQWDQILDKSIYLYTLSWSYVPRFKPNL